MQDHAVAAEVELVADGGRRTASGVPVALGASHSSGMSVATCSSCSVVPTASRPRATGRHQVVGPEALEHGRVPAVGAHQQVAVALEVGGEAADRLLQAARPRAGGRRRWRSTTTPSPSSGSRPACSAASFTVSHAPGRGLVGEERVQHHLVEAPARQLAGVLGPKATRPMGRCSSKLGVEVQHRVRAGGAVVADDRPRPGTAGASARRSPPSAAVVMRAMPKASCMQRDAAPEAEA